MISIATYKNIKHLDIPVKKRAGLPEIKKAPTWFETECFAILAQLLHRSSVSKIETMGFTI